MGKKNGKKQGTSKALNQGEKVHASVLAYYARKQAMNDFAMAVIMVETSKPEGDIDWDVVNEAAENIACDACPGTDEDDPEGYKEPGEIIVRSREDYSKLAALSNRFGGRASLGWATENTLEGIVRSMRAELVTEHAGCSAG